MNWRKSDRELKRLYDINPWMYVIEWRERLNRCVGALGSVRGIDPGVAAMEARALRETATLLTSIAARMEADAARQERIAKLRDTRGRTEEEAQAYEQKANALEETE